MLNQTRCKNCIMDISAKEIVFTETGCNFCDQALDAFEFKSSRTIESVVEQIKSHGQNKEYDCLIGLSGGVDSSYLLTRAVELGLKPLCLTIDNGYNDPIADRNVMGLVEGLKVRLIRYPINLNKFNELLSAFLRSGVRNIEIPTDHILMAATYEVASQYGIKYVLTGGNVATESIMPPSWGYNARDLVHIKDIFKKMTGKKLTGLPTCSLLKFNYYKWIKGIEFIPLLDYMDYDRDQAIIDLSIYGYQNPGPKHEESILTRWFQNFYLFEKFGIDKRKAHLSSQIVSGQITREDALKIIETYPVYPLLGIEQRVLRYAPHEHSYYKTDEKLFNFIGRIIKFFR